MEFVPNYDESQVPDYVLPDPLLCEDGTRVDTPDLWRSKRRPELIRLFETHVYGRAPVGRPEAMHWRELSRDGAVLGGEATEINLAVWFADGKSGLKLTVKIHLPNTTPGPVPAFVGMNHWDDETTVRRAIRRGYGMVTAFYLDLAPDEHDGWATGAVPFFLAEGQTEPAPDEWGTLAVWAWGVSRAIDVLEELPEIDAKRLAVMGHSRQGKAALWAGATDERIALTISNNSGCGGAALSRRRFGETLLQINHAFPNWFCGNFKRYIEKEHELPVDQHQLVALIAPRPVYVNSAIDDGWADPKGEFLACYHASPVYELFGYAPIAVREMPPVHEPVRGVIGYHIREGDHGVTEYDWERWFEQMEARVL